MLMRVHQSLDQNRRNYRGLKIAPAMSVENKKGNGSSRGQLALKNTQYVKTSEELVNCGMLVIVLMCPRIFENTQSI